MTSTILSRRTFATAAAGLGLAASAGAVRVARADEPGSFTFADTVAWNAEYDVVVVGFGGSGAVTSIYAADAGAKVLLIDVAPKGAEGGNTRFAAQMCCTGTDPDETFRYYKDMAWHFDVDDEMLRTYTDGLCQISDRLARLGVTEPAIWPGGGITPVSPEYPEFESGSGIYMTFVHDGIYDSALWQTLYANVMDRTDSIDIWYESPAKHLVQDPISKTVVGIEIDKAGEPVLVRALNGIVLTCGGFENNKDMIQNFLGAPRLAPFGTLYNKGDGVRMGIEVGADLWHMDAYESLGIFGGNAWAVEEGERILLEKAYVTVPSPLVSIDSDYYGKGSAILVGDDGSRFLDENSGNRHGHMYSCGVWRNPIANYTPHLIFDETQLQFYIEKGYIDDERRAKLVSAETPEELAELIGANPEVLARTVDDFNFFASTGRDYCFNRNPESMRPFDGGVLYAARFMPAVLNTQGGPRRNKNAEVLDTAGNPIPHLYSAGELGGITVFQYNSGGNLAECLIFGEIAGTNAAAAKDPLPAYVALEQVDPDIRYIAGEASDVSTDEPAVALGENEYLGIGAGGMGGDITVKVTVVDGSIQAIEIVSESETPSIGGKALNQLVEAAIAGNTSDVDVVTGATMTSKAFSKAVADALSQA